MRRHDYRPPAGTTFGDQRFNQVDTSIVQPVERLVEQPVICSLDEKSHKTGTLALACRKVSHGHIGQMVETKTLEGSFASTVEPSPKADRAGQGKMLVECKPMIEKSNTSGPVDDAVACGNRL